MIFNQILQGRKLKNEYTLKSQELRRYESALEGVVSHEAEIGAELKRLKWQLAKYRDLVIAYHDAVRDYEKFAAIPPYFGPANPKSPSDRRAKKEAEAATRAASEAWREKKEIESDLRQLVLDISGTTLEEFESIPSDFDEEIEHLIRRKKAERDAVLRQKNGAKNNIVRLLQELKELREKTNNKAS